MIRFDGVPSILESLYLSEGLTTKLQEISIEVNPVSLKFLSGKTIIINSRDYVLGTEVGYGNTIISRFPLNLDLVEYVPYLPRILPKVLWSGMTVDSIEEALDSYYYESGFLYFPKIRKYIEARDDLDYIGYIQYQLGYNHYDSPFRDLDILKCRNGLI